MFSHTTSARWRTIARSAALMAPMVAALGTAAGNAHALPLGQCDGPCTTQTTPPPPSNPRGDRVGCDDCASPAAPKQKLVTVYRNSYAYSAPYLNARSRQPIKAATYIATCEANSGSRGRYSNPWWSRLSNGYWVNNGDLRGAAKMGIGDCAAPPNDNRTSGNPRGQGCDCDPPTTAGTPPTPKRPPAKPKRSPTNTPWGACGWRTPESKEVTRYYATPPAIYYLRCGNADWGYRHIVNRHRGDFERLAFGTYQNWRDVAALSMDAIARDPDAAKPTADGKGCLSRVIFLRNIRTNQLVRQQIIRMYFRFSDNAIITVYPHRSQCL